MFIQRPTTVGPAGVSGAWLICLLHVLVLVLWLHLHIEAEDAIQQVQFLLELNFK